jgi:hypothetical protein
MERVLMTEMGTIAGVGNAAILATATVVAGIGSYGLGLLPCGPLCLLGALWLRLTLRLLGTLRLSLARGRLGALWLRLTLRLLGTLRLSLARGRLGALRLCLMLCGLGALGLSRVLRLCGVLWLCLVLRRLGFSSASALFLFFLCEGRKRGSQDEKQNCGGNNSMVFHWCCLQTYVTSASP